MKLVSQTFRNAMLALACLCFSMPLYASGLRVSVPAAASQSLRQSVGAGDPQGRISDISAPASVAKYARFEATFQVANTDANPQLPYVAAPPAYQANLFASEDATKGISVDAFFLPPGQTNWSQAEDQPCFWFLGYDANNLPTGEKDWRARFCPDQTGTWQWRIAVQDAAGTAMSAPQTFTVTASSSHGFLKVSPTDSRYVAWSDGTAFLPASFNDYIGSDWYTPGVASQYIAPLAAAGAYSLQRLWIGSDGGLQIIGGFANSGGRGWGGDDVVPLSAASAPPNGERFCMSGNGSSLVVFCQTGRTYHWNGYVEVQSPQAGHAYAFQFTVGNYSASKAVSASGWQDVSIAVPAAVTYGPNSPCRIGMLDSTTGSRVPLNYTGDIIDDATGESADDNDACNYVTAYDQINSNQLDRAVAAAENASPEQFFSLEVFQHEDQEWNEIQATAHANPADGVSQTYGGSEGIPALGGLYSLPAGVTYATADTPTLRFAHYFARYAMARWGYSTAVRGFECVNESDPASSASVVFDQAVATAFKENASNHLPLMTASYWSGLQAQGGALDIADDHYYLDNGVDTGPYLPFDLSYFYNVRGSQAFQTGGPNGLGELQFSPALPRDAQGLAGNYADNGTSDPNFMKALLAVSTHFQGQGTWTLSYQYKTSPDVQGSDYYVELDSDGALFNDDFPGSGRFYAAPNLNNSQTHCASSENAPYATYQPNTNWTTVSRTFTVPDNNQHIIRSLCVNAPVTAGSVYFSNIRLIGPDGRDWFHLDFSEPAYNVDYASFAEHLGESLTNCSGAPYLDMPLDIGETDGYYAGGDMAKAEALNASGQVTFDAAGNGPRQAAWGLVGPAPMSLQWWNPFTVEEQAVGAWKYYTAVQKIVGAEPVANGHWRSAQPVCGAGLTALGQQDAVTDNSAYLYVYNTAANWDNLANGVSVASVTGGVTLPGIAAGTYTVNRYNPATGALVSTETDTANTSGLAVSFTNLAQDVVITVSPAGQQVSQVITPTPVPAATTLALTSSANPAGYGQAVTLTAQVTPAASSSQMPTGTVTFSNGAVILGTGTVSASGSTAVYRATLTTSALAVGSHTLTAAYSGDANFAASVASAVTQTVAKAATTTTELISSTNPSVAGQPVTITAVVAGSGQGAAPTGTVTFAAGGTSLGTAAVGTSGHAAFSTSSLRTGTYSLTATYSGDGTYSGSASAAASQSIVPTLLHTVVTPVNGSTFVSQTVPSTMSAGHAYTVSVVYKNSGTTSWTNSGSYHLGSQSPQDNTTWGASRVLLPGGVTVAPGQTATFTFTVKAPAAAGHFAFQWAMVQDGVQWFGPYTPSVTVTVH